MILKSLYDYYHRLKDSGEPMPPLGFKNQEIHFVIVLNKDGDLVRIEDRRIDKRTAMTYFVIADSRSSGVNPYVMYDNIEYVLGYVKDGKPEKTQAKHQAFIERCRLLAVKFPKCQVFQSVIKFYESNGPDKVKSHAMWDEMVNKAGAIVSFMLDGATEIAASVKELDNEVSIFNNSKDEAQYCLITGEKGPVAEITTAVFVNGGNPTGAKIVSFQENSGYDSYGKKKGYNAPISKSAEAAFSASLLKLLGKESKNKFTISNRTYIFWTSVDNEDTDILKMGFLSLLGASHEKTSNPNEGIAKMKALLKSIFSGAKPSLQEERFYLLGLSPNSARLAITFWQDASLKDIASRLMHHFEDMEIVDTRIEKTPYMGLYRILGAVTLGGKASDAQPNLADAVIKSIINDTPYPYSLYTSCLRRIRAELSDNMQITRIAILKAYINRLNTNQTNLKVMLDTTNTNLGYLCGRLFAVLEYTQKKANGISGIRERYMNAASATPAAVFATLLNLSNHHLEKLESDGLRIYIENLKQAILALFPSEGFPSHLSIQDQGRFFVGYYHQMQDLYTSKKQN